MKLLLKLLALVSVTLLILSCDSNEPQTNSTLSLTIEDVSCTEAWLQLKTTNLSLPNNITLFVNDLQYENYLINNADTLLYIDSLLPNKNYTFKAVSFYNPEDGVNSNKVNTTTMDTTSHNFTFETFTFGQHCNSVIYDVAIINENNIWAVGEIYMNDSLGNPDPSLYNIIRWDGISWKPERIYYKDNQGQAFLAPLNTIFTFNENNIWLGSDIVFHWDGTTYKSIVIPDAVFNNWINKIWGSSSNDIYIVGNNGNIALYQNGTWTKIESNTTLPIRDIYGIKKQNNENFEILSVADSYGSNEGSKIISIVDNSAKTIWNDGRPYGLVSIWFIPNRKYFAVGDGLWESLTSTTNWVKNNSFPTLYKNYISGQSYNDIVVCGAYWLLAHYNGNSWQTYFPFNSGSFTSVKIKENTIIGVGGSNSKAIVVIGKR